MARLPHILLLLAFWMALSGQVSWLLAAGGLSALAATQLSARRGLLIQEWRPRNLLRLLAYLPWLLGQVLIANWRVLKLVWHPRLPIDPRLVKVPTQLHTSLGRVLFANSITLTPGTVTLEVQPTELLVHALSVQDAEGLQDGKMEARLLALEPSQAAG